MSDILESLFKGVDILIDKKLENVSFDSTIVCSIINNSNSKNGEYKVSDGSVSYIAYSDQSDYKVGDQVRVSIPMGDFSQKKFIVGKYSVDENQPITYVSPADQILNISNNLISQNSLMASILANGNTAEKVIWQKELDESFTAMQTNNLYNTIVLKASFKTLLDSYDLIQGNYGLRLDILVKPSIDSKVKMLRSFELDSSEMFGNPYSFAIPATQSKILKIDSIGIVLAVELVLYQKNNFLNNRNNPISYSLDNNPKDNIIVNNIVIGFGCDLTALEDNKLQIYTTDEPTYKYGIHNESTNLKSMGLLWINKDENNQYVGFSDGIYDPIYDELEYLEKTRLDNRLLMHKGKENVPQDKESLELAANIDEGAAAINKVLDLISIDLYSLLLEFQRHVPPTSTVYTFIQNFLVKPEEGQNPSENTLIDIIDTVANNLKDLQAMYANALQYGYETWKDILPRKAEWQSISTAYLINIGTKYDNLIAFIDNLTSLSIEGYGSICNTYKIRIEKLKKKIEDIVDLTNVNNPLNQAQFWNNGDRSKLEKYVTKTSFPVYQTPDLSSYDNKYCIYWYRWEKDYVASENEQLLPNGWRRLTNIDGDFSYVKDNMDKDKINIGLSSEYKDEDNNNILNDKGQKLHAPRPEPGYGVLRRYMQNDLEQEKYMAVLFYNHEMYKSNELIFMNSEVVPDKTTLDKGDILIFEHKADSRDGYQSYATTNHLMDVRDQTINRQIRCHYDGLLAKDNAFVNGQIYWYVPTVSTMLTVDESVLLNNGFELDITKSEAVYQVADDITEDNFKNKKSKLYKIDNGKYCLLTSNDNEYDNNITYYYRESIGSELCFYKTISAAKKDGEFQYEWDQWDYTNGTTLDNRDFWYKIKPYYEDSAKNNYIRCEFVQHADVDSVWGEQVFSFGVAGTSGTKYTLAITPTTTKIAADVNEGLPLTIELKDFNNNLIAFENDKAISIDWYLRNHSEAASAPNTYIDYNDQNTQAFAVTPPDYWGLIIAKTTVGLNSENNIVGTQFSSDSELADRLVDLEVLYSIPYAWSEYFIQGPTQIIYNSLGTLDNTSMFNTPYKLFKKNSDGSVNQENVTWSLSYKIKNGEITENLNEKEKSFYNSYMPKIKNEDNTLVPAPMYLDNLNCYPVLQAKDSSGNILWRQVIIITQNRYSSPLLNNWDGEFKIDEENGTIMSTMLGAGRKTSNNTFEGVLMGDVGAAAGINVNEQNIPNQNGLGIYGFNDGAQSFGFNIDGTAFLGKAGRGRIRIDGNSGTISSASYQQNPETAGMMIDLDDGFIDMRGTIKNDDGSYSEECQDNDANKQSHIRFDVKSPYAQIISDNGNYLMYISNNREKYSSKYFLQTDDYKVNESGVRLDLDNGLIDAYKFKIKAGDSLILNSNPSISSDYYFYAGNTDNNIYFQKDGELNISAHNFILQSGDKGTDDYLALYSHNQSESTQVGPSGDRKDWRIVAGNKFGVTAGGYMYASGGNIAGWVFDNQTFQKDTYNNEDINKATECYRTFIRNPKDTTELTSRAFSVSYWKRENASEGWGTEQKVFYVDHKGYLYAKDAYIEGEVHATSGKFSGTITAGSGSQIGGWTITSSSIYAGSTYLYNTGKLQSGTKFTVDTDGTLTATGATVSGKLTASEGSIGGWTINSQGIHSGTDYSSARVGMSATSASYAFWAGYDATTEKAAFQVTSSGDLTATTGTIKGAFTITSNGQFNFNDLFKLGYTTKKNENSGITSESYIELWYNNTRYVGTTNTIRYVHNVAGLAAQDYRYMDFIYGVLVGDSDKSALS